MKNIGLTGGIGSGKSTVSRILVNRGIPVYNSDYKAKLLMDWSPKFSGIKGFTKGLEKTISWFIKDENLSK